MIIVISKIKSTFAFSTLHSHEKSMRIVIISILLFVSSFLHAQTMSLEMSNFYDQLAMQDFEQKIKTIDKAIQKHPKEPWCYLMKASVFDMMGGLEKVAECYNKCLAIDSAFSCAQASLGRCYVNDESELNDLDKALYRYSLKFEFTALEELPPIPNK
jgi:tetratricopeptide (TPR) repeat protein